MVTKPQEDLVRLERLNWFCLFVWTSLYHVSLNTLLDGPDVSFNSLFVKLLLEIILLIAVFLLGLDSSRTHILLRRAYK